MGLMLDKKCERCGEQLMILVLANEIETVVLIRPLRATKCKEYRPGMQNTCQGVGETDTEAMERFGTRY